MAVGSQPTLAMVVGFKSFENTEAGHLVKLIKIQAITRKGAKMAAWDEHPLAAETAPGLLDLILKFQGTDPLCTRLKKELVIISSQNGHLSLQGRMSQEPISRQSGHVTQKGHMSRGVSREGYTLEQGLLCYKGRAVVPAQKALIQELLYLYHNDQFAGH